MKKISIRIFSLLLGTLFLMNLVACDSNKYTGESISHSVEDSLKTLDPQLATTSAERTVVKNVFLGLMTTDVNNEIVPGAASSYTYDEEKLTYKFELFDNLYFSDGETKLTAKDFAFGLKRAVSSQLNAPLASTLFAIKNAKACFNNQKSENEIGIRVVNDLELEISLENQDSNFLSTLTTSIAMPCNQAFFNSTNGKYGLNADSILTNGPFKIKLWDNDSKFIRINRFDEFNGLNKAIPSSVKINFSKESSEVSTAINQEMVDSALIWSASITSNLYKVKEVYNKNYSLFISKDLITSNGLKLNKVLLSDIDNSSINLNITNKNIESETFFPLSNFELNPDTFKDYILIDKIKYNKEKSLSQIKGTNALDILSGETIYYPNNIENVKLIANLIAQTWQKDLSAYINTKDENESTILSGVRNGDIKIAILPSYSLTNNAYDSLLTFYKIGINEFDSSYDSTKKITGKSIQNLESILFKSNSLYPLIQTPSLHYFKTTITDLFCLEDGITVNFIFAKKGS